MDWIVFGDDWGRHPSTTQHLVRALPDGDRVVWLDSIAMRAPRFSTADLGRAWRKLPRLRRPSERESTASEVTRLTPILLPWHTRPTIRRINRLLLRRTLAGTSRRMGLVRPTVLCANPVAAYYANALCRGLLAYLRLDDYPRLPGVDAELARHAERRMRSKADLCFATAQALIPEEPEAQETWHYLPQGVDVAHFGRVPTAPPEGRVLGFFGLLAEWIDFDLIAAVADARPDWTIELRGPVRVLPDSLRTRANVRVLPALPYAQLPEAIAHWRAAWLPFRVSELTRGVNPLKAREYLAAGLPCISTPLPELAALPQVAVGASAKDVIHFLECEALADTEGKRLARRAAMLEHSWSARAASLRQSLMGLDLVAGDCFSSGNRTTNTYQNGSTDAFRAPR